MVLHGVSRSVFAVLGCASMLFVVRFHVGCGAHWVCWVADLWEYILSILCMLSDMVFMFRC